MTPQFARVLTALYSRRWRRRYGREFEAMLQHFPATPPVVTDVLLRALWSRRAAFGAAIFAGIAIALAASNIARVQPREQPVSVASACRYYSSATPSGWINRNQCLG
jgi:hypothetical protein